MKTLWQDEINLLEKPALNNNFNADVIIVGGGITGITSAYLLSKAGKKVVVVDKDNLLNSTTAYTTAFLSSDIDTAAQNLVSMFGFEKAKKIWSSGANAIDEIEELIKNENIDCEFKRCDQYLYATSLSGLKRIKEESRIAKSFGFDLRELKKNDLIIKNKGGCIFKNQAKFNPLKYIVALREKAEKLGAVFYENSEALEIKATDTAFVKTKNYSLTGKHVIVATYLSIKNPLSIYLQKGTYISYIYELLITKNILPEGLYIDDMNPYHYFRIDKGSKKDRMILGGEDHRKELPININKNFKSLRKYINKYLPGMNYEIIKKWSGPILESIDGLPFIGAPDKKCPALLVATAFSGNGMTYSMTAAKILTDKILGKENIFTEVYDPYRRRTLQGLWCKTRDYVGEFFGGYFRNLFK